MVELENDPTDFIEFGVNKSSIKSDSGTQSFWIILNCKERLIDYAILKMNYKTSEGFEFIQDIILFKNTQDEYQIDPSPIIDKTYQVS
jgi:hypothetical protein